VEHAPKYGEPYVPARMQQPAVPPAATQR
jgi:hypothetical protein